MRSKDIKVRLINFNEEISFEHKKKHLHKCNIIFAGATEQQTKKCHSLQKKSSSRDLEDVQITRTHNII